MRFVQREQDRIAVLLQPIRQPQHGITPSLRADLERDPRNAGLEVYGEIFEDSRRLSDRAANAPDQHFGRRQVFGEKPNLGDGKLTAILFRLIGQPSQKHGLAIAARPVKVCQTGTLLTGAKPVHDIQ